MHILKRISPSEFKSFAEVYQFLAPGELLAGVRTLSYAQQWQMADASHFAPVPAVQAAAA